MRSPAQVIVFFWLGWSGVFFLGSPIVTTPFTETRTHLVCNGPLCAQRKANPTPQRVKLRGPVRNACGFVDPVEKLLDGKLWRTLCPKSWSLKIQRNKQSRWLPNRESLAVPGVSMSLRIGFMTPFFWVMIPLFRVMESLGIDVFPWKCPDLRSFDYAPSRS